MRVSAFTVILIFIVFMTAGIALVPLLPFKLKPSTELPSVSVSFFWQGVNGQVIEQEVTSVLEGVLSTVRGAKKVTSTSSTGKGSIIIDIDNSVPLDAVRLEIASLVRQTYSRLPAKVSYPLISMSRPDNESDRPLLIYTINAPAAPYLIQQYTEKIIKPALLPIKGIEDIHIFGATSREWLMTYHAEHLKSLALTTNDIQEAINQYFSSGSAGMAYELNTGSDTSVIHLIFKKNVPDMAAMMHIPVKMGGSRIVYLKDIVTVQRREQEPASYYRLNGANTINMVVYPRELENQLNLSEAINQKVAKIQKTLPAGYFLVKNYDATEFIRDELSKNSWRAVLTVVILLAFVLVFTQNWRYLLLIVISLLANLSIAAIFYYLFKIEMHVYALAGLTVSLSLIKNNSIVMIEHYHHKRDLKVFMAILASTLTAIAALAVTFFVEEKLRVHLVDFGIIVIINLSVSLFTALFLIPALMEKMPFRKKRLAQKRFLFWGKRKRNKVKNLWMTRGYGRMIKFTVHYKWAFILLLIWGFGLPVWMLPAKLEEEQNWFDHAYNATFGSDTYNEHIRPVADKALGGALRIFVQHVFYDSYYGDIEKTTLYVTVELPNGATIDQTNELASAMEGYVQQFKEIEQFETQVYERRAQMRVFFTKEADVSGFPYQLEEMVTQQAIDLGGADWKVSGAGEGFNNAVRESAGQYKITMHGYNYDELLRLADKVKTRLMVNPRIKEVTTLSRSSWYRDLSKEYVMSFDREKLIAKGVSPAAAVLALQDYVLHDNTIAFTIVEGEREQIRLVSVQSKKMDFWQVQHHPVRSGKTIVKLNELASVKEEAISQDVVKENQQYKLILAYNYIGQDEIARTHQKEVLDEIEPTLPLEYSITAEGSRPRMDEKDKQQYGWLLLVIGVIFFVCAVLFESLVKPLAVILTIPISYIGLFLTFYLFEINFDQGGFAALILLSGITVSSALYIINDFIHLKRGKNHHLPAQKMYLKAFNHKIFSVLLIILSTVLGLVPFLGGEQKEVFWPALAAGTIGGLIFSLIGIVFYLPMFMLGRERRTTNQ